MTQATESPAAEAPAVASPSDRAFELRQILKSQIWAHGLQFIEILEWVCGTDRQFDRAKSKALTIIHRQEDATVAVVNQKLKERKP